MKSFFSFKVVLLLSLFLLFSYGKGFKNLFNKSQDENNDPKIQSIFSAEGLKPSGGYGSSFVKGVFLSKGEGVLIGGKGAFIFNGSFAFGGYGAGFVGNATKDDYKMGMGFGGLFVESIFSLSSPIHFALANYVGLGGFGGKKNEDQADEEKIGKFGVVLNPELNIEVNITPYFIVALGVGYQLVFADFNKVFTADDFSGLTLNLDFKWGKF